MYGFNKKQDGFSLLEVLLAVSIAIAIGSLQLGNVRRDTENIQAKAVGEQGKMVGQGLNNYLSLRYDKLILLSSVADAGTADDPGPRTCDVATGMCIITSDTLRRNGLLPNSFSGRNAYGATYEYYIRVQGTVPNQRVDGMVVTSTPYTIGGNPRFDLLGHAMTAAGADSGTTRTLPTRMDGLNGGWQETGFPINQIGLFGYRVGYGTAGWSSFVRIDGTSSMTGDFNLDGHDINNVRNLNATGFLRSNRLITNEGSDAIVIGDISDPMMRTQIGSINGATTIASNNGVSFINGSLTNPQPSPISAGDITVGSVQSSGTGNFVGHIQGDSLSTIQDVQSGGTISSAGRIFSGQNFETSNGSFISGTGTVSVGGSISSGSTVSAGGATLSSNQVSFVRGGGWYMTDNDWIRSQGDKNIYTGGEIRAGQITADGLIIAKSNIQIDSVAVAGGSCPAAGRITRDNTGRVLSCVGGLWETGTGIKNSTQINGSSGTSSSAACPTGYKLSGGGFQLINRPSVNDGFGPAQSFGNVTGNTWQVVSGSGSIFQAVAYCVN